MRAEKYRVARQISWAVLGNALAALSTLAQSQPAPATESPTARAVTVVTWPYRAPGDWQQASLCVEETLKARLPALPFRTGSEFRDLVFPWFEPGTAPWEPEALTRLLKRPEVVSRVRGAGIRWLVSVWGQTRTSYTGEKETFWCGGGGMSGAGCIGYISGNKTSIFEATLWDLETGQPVHTGKSEISNDYVAVIGFAIPVPLPGFSHAQQACEEIAEQLKPYLTGTPSTARDAEKADRQR